MGRSKGRCSDVLRRGWTRRYLGQDDEKPSIPDADAEGAAEVDLVSAIEYRMSQRRRIEYQPGIGARGAAGIEVEFDALGREVRRRTFGSDANTPQVEQHIGYDIHGVQVHVSDGVRIATLSAVDSLGRVVETVGSDGLHQRTRYDALDRAILQETFVTNEDGSETIVSHGESTFSEEGRILRQSVLVDPLRSFIAANDWLHGGLETLTSRGGAAPGDLRPSSAVRFTSENRDAAGRTIQQSILRVSPDSEELENISRISFGRFVGDVALEQRFIDSGAARQTASSFTQDFLGRVTSTLEGGAFLTLSESDQAGNVIASTSPGRAAQQMQYDARGLLVRHEREDGATILRSYDANGALRRYVDQEGKVTRYDVDSIGRTFRVRYPDGTSEETRFEPLTGAVIAARDRAGEWVTFVFDAAGRVVEERYGGDGDEPVTGGETILRRVYDAAGRLTREIQRDGAIEYAEFDLLGRPAVTRVVRYDTSGCDPYAKLPCGAGPIDGGEGSPVETYTQLHRWSVYEDERERWRMPFMGVLEPSVAEEGFRSWIVEERDEVGSIVRVGEASSADDPVQDEILRLTRRGAGMLHERSRRLENETWLTTKYGYADAAAEDSDPASLTPYVIEDEAPTGRLAEAITSVGDVILAGGRTRIGADRLLERFESSATPSRASEWSYDARGRLDSAAMQVAAVEAVSENVLYTLSDADRVDARTVVPAALPGAHAPPSWQVMDASDAHQIVSLSEDGSPEPRVFTWNGGRRTSDGVWTAVWDIRGRLVLMEAPTLGRRVRYTWTPGDRLLGRTQERLTDIGTWVVETRPEQLNGLPAEATFVWDPVTDRLVAIYDSAAARANASDALVRQFIHGDAAYDDPVEIVVRTETGVEKFYPVRDEAAAGSLEAVVDSSGGLIERVVYADPYGDGQRYLHGAALERITRSAEGVPALELHFTDVPVASSLPGAISVTARKSDGSRESLALTSVTSSSRIVTLELPLEFWSDLDTGYSALEVEVDARPRFEGWGDRPAHSYRSPDLAAAATNIAISIPLTTGPPPELFTIGSLHEIASPHSRTNLHLGIHATTFADPATGHHYIRARWYDPATATFLSPDPMGYQDSSSLYTAFAGDPVNMTDPTGEIAALAYLGWVAVNTGIDLAIDYGFHQVGDWWTGEDTEFDWHASLQTNFAVNLVTAGLGAKVKRFGRVASFGFDVLATGTIDMAVRGQTAGEAFGSAAVGHGVGAGMNHGVRRVRQLLDFSDVGEAAVRGFAHGLRDIDMAPSFSRRIIKEVTDDDLAFGLSRAERLRKVRKRPCRYRCGVVEDVWSTAKGPDGRVYDPNTLEELFWDRTKSRERQWDMGHKPQKSYKQLKNQFLDGEISWKEFLDEYHNPSNYRPESVPENRSRRNDR